MYIKYLVRRVSLYRPSRRNQYRVVISEKCVTFTVNQPNIDFVNPTKWMRCILSLLAMRWELQIWSNERLQCTLQTRGPLTGKGLAPSWITNPSIRWVRMWDLTRVWARLRCPLCWLLCAFPFPGVMTGAMAAPCLSTQAAGQNQ